MNKYCKLSDEFLNKIMAATIDNKSGEKTIEDYEIEINKIIVEHHSEVNFISVNNFVSRCIVCGKEFGNMRGHVICSMECHFKHHGIQYCG